MSQKKLSLSFFHLLRSSQINQNDIFVILNLADKYSKEFKNGRRKWSDCDGKILATLFFEPSTRTRFSSESAMLRLGGQILTLEQGISSSIKKGESLSDMGRVVSSYADIVVMRHPEKNSVEEFSKYSSIPVINGGDGVNEHPTQALSDLYSIYDEKGRLDNLVIGILGDLKHGRTAHSLLKLMSLYPNNKFVLISDQLSKLDEQRKNDLLKTGVEITETENLQQSIKELDVLYVTRLQKERFDDVVEYEKIKNKYSITARSLKEAKKNLAILHPLPRVNEISTEVDAWPQAKYFKQSDNAVFVRMALFSLLS